MLRITTVSGKVLPLVFNIVHYKLRITTASVYLCVQILSAHPLKSTSGCSSGIVIVSPSQKINLYPDNPTFLSTFYTMSHCLTEEYWESLGPNGPFLCELFHTQSQQLSQLQLANNILEDRTMEAQTNISDAAAKAMSAIAQAILMNMLMGSHLPRGARAAELESFNGSRDKAEQFV